MIAKDCRDSRHDFRRFLSQLIKKNILQEDTLLNYVQVCTHIQTGAKMNQIIKTRATLFIAENRQLTTLYRRITNLFAVDGHTIKDNLRQLMESCLVKETLRGLKSNTTFIRKQTLMTSVTTEFISHTLKSPEVLPFDFRRTQSLLRTLLQHHLCQIMM